MTPLRKQMIEALQARGFSPRTHESYLEAVADLAGYYHRSPERLSPKDVKAYFHYLAVERGLAGASCRVHLHGVRFLYLQVLERRDFDMPIPLPKKAQRIPELLSRSEVARILAASTPLQHRTMLSLCYGCGLRVSEWVAVKVRHLDGERRLLRVEQGKGAKDRLVPVGEALLALLREYWRAYRPGQWLFPKSHKLGHPEHPLGVSTAQKAFQHAKAAAGIEKVGGIHSLRHAYATHQLEAGLPVHQLQHLLGHQSIKSTLRYVHWRPNDPETPGPRDLLGALAQMPEREVCHG
jgi:integrase/recombinase XerD